MVRVHATAESLEFHERLSFGLRAVLVALGLLPFLAPYELLVEPDWPGLSPLMLPLGIVSLGATLVGLVFLLAGVFGLDRTLRFDARSRRVTYAFESPLRALRRRHYPFAAVSEVSVVVHEWESRADSYGLLVVFADGQRISLADENDRAEVERWVARLRGWIESR